MPSKTLAPADGEQSFQQTKIRCDIPFFVRGPVPCCASAMSGHPAIMPPNAPMNSRRFTGSPSGRGSSYHIAVLCITANLAANGRCGSKRKFALSGLMSALAGYGHWSSCELVETPRGVSYLRLRFRPRLRLRRWRRFRRKGYRPIPNNRATWTADHLPPRAAGMPRSSRPAVFSPRADQLNTPYFLNQAVILFQASSAASLR